MSATYRRNCCWVAQKRMVARPQGCKVASEYRQWNRRREVHKDADTFQLQFGRSQINNRRRNPLRNWLVQLLYERMSHQYPQSQVRLATPPLRQTRCLPLSNPASDYAT